MSTRRGGASTLVPAGVADRPGAGSVTLRVVRKAMLADGVCGLSLASLDGRRLPDWTPGAHIDVTFAGGLTRQYSLCGDRWNPHTYDIAVLLEPDSRGASTFVHQDLREGDTVDVGGPRNNFFVAPAGRYVFIAGGIGITPLLPMIRQADFVGADWSLLYGGRTRGSMAFLDELRQWGDRVTVRPQDEYGLLDLRAALEAEGPGTKVYCCGPGPLIDALTRIHSERTDLDLRVERFVAMEQGPPARTTPFEVLLARSGTTVVVEPGVSVLDAVAGVGYPLLASCRQGTCGTCETTLIEGVPDHRDSLLNDAERARGDCFYPCVSRAMSDRLVIDA